MISGPAGSEVVAARSARTSATPSSCSCGTGGLSMRETALCFVM